MRGSNFAPSDEASKINKWKAVQKAVVVVVKLCNVCGESMGFSAKLAVS